jgi:predicted nuclease of predicted toxin-antitoxin system
VRLLLDEMYLPALAACLRERGMDAIAVKEFAELAGLDDEAILALAKLGNRVLVSENVADFAFIGRTVDHVGIVFLSSETVPSRCRSSHGLVSAPVQLDRHPPFGLGSDRIDWWLQPATS